MGAAIAARAHRMKPTGFVPDYHGIDDIYESAGKLVIVEAKGGTSHLAGSQMSKQWINTQIDKLLKSTNPADLEWGRKLKMARDQGNLQGMTVRTKIDGNNLVSDPEFELKDWTSIGSSEF